MKQTEHTHRTIPRPGEIRIGTAQAPTTAHRYSGTRPYLVISNERYNKTSGQCEVIPFTTKRFRDSNPVHVDFKAGDIAGLCKNSTLVVESRDILPNESLSEPIGFLSQRNWKRVSKAMIFQNPYILAALCQQENITRLHLCTTKTAG